MNKLLLLFVFVLAATGLQAQNTKAYTLAILNEKGKKINTAENKIGKLDMRAAKTLKLQLLDKNGKPATFTSMSYTCAGKDSGSGSMIMDGTVKTDGVLPESITRFMSEWVLSGKLYVENIQLNGQPVKETFVIEVLP